MALPHDTPQHVTVPSRICEAFGAVSTRGEEGGLVEMNTL